MKRKMMSWFVASGFARLAACALLSLAGVWCAWGDVAIGKIAPINPAFKEWQRKRNLNGDSAVTNAVAKGGRLLSAPSEAEAYPLGYVPSTIDYSYLRDLNYQNVYQAGSSALPSKFDLRDNQMVTSVKNQGSFGTCWSHATMGALESMLLMKGEGAFDFSEKHLANTHGFDLSFTNGGNGTMATAYLTRWSGPIAESEDPYPTSSYVPSSPEGTPLGHVQNVKILAPMSDASDTAEIKKTVMEHGGVYVGYYHVWNALSSNGRNFYWNGNESLIRYGDGGHAVLIVGWDDDYPKSNFEAMPPGNGAFIVKNSWGSGFGDNGYFYVSYYDATFGREELFSFVNLEPIDNYDAVYQYDPLGMVSSIGYSKTTAWGAAMFTASETTQLASVGFYALVPNTAYAIYVYTGCSASAPRSGILATSQSGKTDSAGFFTIPLSSKASLSARERFSVVIQLTTPGYNYPLAFEYASPRYSSEATASAGETFMSSNGSSWTDFTSYNGSASFCCKAYTRKATVVKPTLSSIARRFVADFGRIGAVHVRGDVFRRIEEACFADLEHRAQRTELRIGDFRRRGEGEGGDAAADRDGQGFLHGGRRDEGRRLVVLRHHCRAGGSDGRDGDAGNGSVVRPRELDGDERCDGICRLSRRGEQQQQCAVP